MIPKWMRSSAASDVYKTQKVMRMEKLLARQMAQVSEGKMAVLMDSRSARNLEPAKAR